MIEYVSYEEPNVSLYADIVLLCRKQDAYWRLEVDDDGNCVYILSLSEDAIQKY